MSDYGQYSKGSHSEKKLFGREIKTIDAGNQKWTVYQGNMTGAVNIIVRHNNFEGRSNNDGLNSIAMINQALADDNFKGPSNSCPIKNDGSTHRSFGGGELPAGVGMALLQAPEGIPTSVYANAAVETLQRLSQQQHQQAPFL